MAAAGATVVGGVDAAVVGVMPAGITDPPAAAEVTGVEEGAVVAEAATEVPVLSTAEEDTAAAAEEEEEDTLAEEEGGGKSDYRCWLAKP